MRDHMIFMWEFLKWFYLKPSAGTTKEHKVFILNFFYLFVLSVGHTGFIVRKN